MDKFRRIGAGFCGTVWTSPCEESVHFGRAFKREDGGPGRSLLNDFRMHQSVLEAREKLSELPGFESSSVHIYVPRFAEFIGPEDGWWNSNLEYFPSGYTACNMILSERIPAVSQKARELLIDRYCPSSFAAEIKTSEANEDCLIRPYLGRRRYNAAAHTRPSRFKAFSLRNYPLHLDQMEELGLDAADLVHYVEVMAEALAMMHWLAGIDANDVEFVLAPPRSAEKTPAVISNKLGDHVMWILDFDCCNRLSFDIDGVDQAVTAFFKNDPFYPRPNSSSALWAAFRRKYIEVSNDILQTRLLNDNDKDDIQKLPEAFMQRIEERI
ncbi:hypothetical protein PRK78_005161 [Emydomyces testavorans]|uniref:DUF3669 domain-containing protein n=1 Tax=Emydomyces testavorans TaxID=2070801 RepID=A0AAF0IK92_9EURO|nr:hypothetical protein PRK78_005161 [Emydomyces testavorans]